MNDYETARAALQHAIDHPDAFTADQIDALTEIVKAGRPPESYTPMSETGPEIGPPTVTQLDARKRKQQGIERAEREHPEIVNALKASGLPAGMPIHTAEENMEASRGQNESYDEGLASASHRKDFFAPPEYIAPPKPAAAGGPAPAFGMPGVSFNTALPDIPKVVSYHEPSVDEFHAELGPIYGERILRKGSESPEYQEWADKKWQERRQLAEQQGESIVRVAYGKGGADPNVTGFSGGLMGGLLGPLAGHLPPSSTFPDARESAREMEKASHGGAGLAGELTGAYFNPFFRAAEAALPVKGAISGLRVGAAGGGGMALAGDIARKVEGENVSPGEEVKDFAEGAALPGALGFLGGGLGGVLGRQGEKLRNETNLGKLERGGYARTSVLHGLEPGPEMVEAQDLARKQGFVDKATGEPLVAKREALSLVKPFTEEARAREASGAKYTNETKQAIYEANKNKLISTQPVLDAIEDAENSSSRVDHEGRPLTPEAARELRQLAKMKEYLIDPEFTQLAGGRVARALEPEAVDGFIKQIQQLDEKALRQGAPTGKKPLPDFERIKAAAHGLRDQIKMLGEETPREDLTAAQTPSKANKGGYSKFLRERSDEMAQRNNERQILGLPTRDQGMKILPENLDFDKTTAVRNSIMNAEPEAEQTLHDFAEATGKTGTLDRLRAYQAYDALKKQMAIIGRLRLGGLHPHESIGGKGIAFRLDPVLQKILAPGAAGTSRLGPMMRHRLGGPLESILAGDIGPSHPETIDEINELLNQGGANAQ